VCQIRYYRRALDFLERSLELYGENETTYHNMALCYYGLQRMDTSMEYVNKALALDPKFDAAKGLRTKLQADMKRFGLSAG
jgi:Tfp pilus assembly protein PilF